MRPLFSASVRDISWLSVIEIPIARISVRTYVLNLFVLLSILRKILPPVYAVTLNPVGSSTLFTFRFCFSAFSNATTILSHWVSLVLMFGLLTLFASWSLHTFPRFDVALSTCALNMSKKSKKRDVLPLPWTLVTSLLISDAHRLKVRMIAATDMTWHDCLNSSTLVFDIKAASWTYFLICCWCRVWMQMCPLNTFVNKLNAFDHQISTTSSDSDSCTLYSQLALTNGVSIIMLRSALTVSHCILSPMTTWMTPLVILW